MSEWQIFRRDFARFCTVTLAGVALAAADGMLATSSAAPKTGKERLTDKASDEQRVDDCKVAQSQRTRERPTACR
jgi:hypothetical protein